MNGTPVHLLPGMTVGHALVQLGLLQEGKGAVARIRDSWGNLVGLDGALKEGDEIFFEEDHENESQQSLLQKAGEP